MGIFRRITRIVSSEGAGVGRGVLSFDGAPEQARKTVGDGHEQVRSVGYVNRDGGAHAAYWLFWYPHADEAWLDATLGTWEDGFPRQATFGCRIGAVQGTAGPACSLVQAGSMLLADPPSLMGTLLGPDDAREHPWLPAFWELVDWLIVADPLARKHLHRS